MKYLQILAALNEPALMTPALNASIRRVLADHGSRPRAQDGEKAQREGTDPCGENVELAQAEMVDGIMHIPVTGPIGRGLGSFEKGAGAVDWLDIVDEVESAEEDENCRGIIFHIDSAGGTYNGTPEACERILQCTKTTAAYVPGMAASASYWLASSCNYVCATISADVGSVGVYCYLLDESKSFDEMGLKAELITSGKYKGMGAPGTSLTTDQRKHLQDRVDEMYKTFTDHVLFVRPDIDKVDCQGQIWKAPTALTKGFIDMIVPDCESVIELF